MKKPYYQRVLVRDQSQSSWDHKSKPCYSFSNSLLLAAIIWKLYVEKWWKYRGQTDGRTDKVYEFNRAYIFKNMLLKCNWNFLKMPCRREFKCFFCWILLFYTQEACQYLWLDDSEIIRNMIYLKLFKEFWGFLRYILIKYLNFKYLYI
jgi:hypothetical protein